jgi:energy-coupling factor transporter ATP-binding protein EcfA2
MFNQKKFLLLLLLGAFGENRPEQPKDGTSEKTPAQPIETSNFNEIISEKNNFQTNYEKILGYITSEEYEKQISSPINSGFFVNNIQSHQFDITAIPSLLEKTKAEIRNEKYNFLGAFQLFEAIPIDPKINQKIQDAMFNSYKTKMTELPLQALDSNIDDKNSIPGLLNALRSPVDTNMFLFGKHICNMPEIKEKIDSPELETLIKNSYIERLFKKNAFNNNLLLENNIQIDENEIKNLKKNILSLNKKIDETYSNLKKGFEYVKYLPIELNKFYDFVINPSEDRVTKIHHAKLREDIDYFISTSMQNQILLNSAFKKISRSLQEKLATLDTGSSAFPTTTQSITNFIAAYGETLTEEEKTVVFNEAANYIFSSGVILHKAYQPGTKFYNGILTNITINSDIPIQEKLSFIIENLFTIKKIKFSGKKVETNSFATNFNMFFEKNKLYNGFLDITTALKNLSLTSAKFFKNPQDIFAINSNLALNEMILALCTAKESKKDESINFLTKNPYGTVYLNKNKEVISSVFETAFLTFTKPILASLMPHSIKQITSDKKEEKILRAEKIYNIQTQQPISGKFDLIGTQLLFGPAGSGKSSLFKTLAAAMQVAAFLGQNKTYVSFETNLSSVPTFMYERNTGEINNQKIGAGLSNFQANVNKILKIALFVKEYINTNPVLILDEVFSAGNPQTVTGFVKSPIWKELMDQLMSSFVIEHNVDTLTALSAAILNVIGQKVVSKEGTTALASKDLLPFEKTITQAEKEFLKQQKKDPRFYFMINLKDNKLVEVSENFYHQNKGTSDNHFCTASFSLDKILFTTPDYLNEEGDIKLQFFPQFHLIEPSKNNVADSTLVFWGKIEPIFEKDQNNKIIDVKFKLLKEEDKDYLPYFRVDSSNIKTEGIFQILSQEINTTTGKNKTMTFFEDHTLQNKLNDYTCKAAEVAIAAYNEKIARSEKRN